MASYGIRASGGPCCAAMLPLGAAHHASPYVGPRPGEIGLPSQGGDSCAPAGAGRSAAEATRASAVASTAGICRGRIRSTFHSGGSVGCSALDQGGSRARPGGWLLRASGASRIGAGWADAHRFVPISAAPAPFGHPLPAAGGRSIPKRTIGTGGARSPIGGSGAELAREHLRQGAPRGRVHADPQDTGEIAEAGRGVESPEDEQHRNREREDAHQAPQEPQPGEEHRQEGHQGTDRPSDQEHDSEVHAAVPRSDQGTCGDLPRKGSVRRPRQDRRDHHGYGAHQGDACPPREPAGPPRSPPPEATVPRRTPSSSRRRSLPRPRAPAPPPLPPPAGRLRRGLAPARHIGRRTGRLPRGGRRSWYRTEPPARATPGRPRRHHRTGRRRRPANRRTGKRSSRRAYPRLADAPRKVGHAAQGVTTSDADPVSSPEGYFLPYAARKRPRANDCSQIAPTSKTIFPS